MPKNARKMKFLMLLLKYLTPLVLKEIVEKPFFTTMWLCNKTSILENMIQKIQ